MRASNDVSLLSPASGLWTILRVALKLVLSGKDFTDLPPPLSPPRLLLGSKNRWSSAGGGAG